MILQFRILITTIVAMLGSLSFFRKNFQPLFEKFPSLREGQISRGFSKRNNQSHLLHLYLVHSAPETGFRDVMWMHQDPSYLKAFALIVHCAWKRLPLNSYHSFLVTFFRVLFRGLP